MSITATYSTQDNKLHLYRFRLRLDVQAEERRQLQNAAALRPSRRWALGSTARRALDRPNSALPARGKLQATDSTVPLSLGGRVWVSFQPQHRIVMTHPSPIRPKFAIGSTQVISPEEAWTDTLVTQAEANAAVSPGE